MVSPSHFAAFAALVFVMVVVPGPSVLFTVSRALTVGRRDALITVLGNAAGVYAQVVAVAFGMGAIVRTSATVFTVIKLAGAAYLVYLGVQAVRHRRKLSEALASAVPATRGRTLTVLRDGFVVGFANPKSIVFLAAVLPQFVDDAAGSVPVQIMLLGIALPAIAVFSDSAWALVAGTARAWFARSPRRLELIGGTGGLVMIGLGAGLALNGRKD
ncbi:LysE family translocator [Amycolatopsis thermophila]|uniref:Threonine/homoserine/homoserine lactone efflux protein n=1 Tax=Amycolatopsis thermophila TaxID=206084 RepID=A0ABU0EZW4_9PSEU|nr:LysE family translocator [Amycolatopsis thermophila]MDQ0380816.1 threonine/homoserine/homoserine lactone efflux protein [Amycolatopsis thermophila]